MNEICRGLDFDFPSPHASARYWCFQKCIKCVLASVIFFGQITVQRYLFCLSIHGLWTLYIQELLYKNASVSASEKNRTFARKFAAQGVEINGVKVHFNVKYFCKKN